MNHNVPPASINLSSDLHKRKIAPHKAEFSLAKSLEATRDLLRSETAQWTDKEKWMTLKTTVGPRPILTVILHNIRAAVLVAMVSVSLSIGLGIASGASPTAGLRTAIWGGLICGALGSSPFNIIGPAGALTGMLTTYSAQWGEDILPWIAIFSGIICFIVVNLGLQKYCLFMPKSVFEGFTLAVALIIGLKQINYAFGLHGLDKHEHFIENVYESLKNLDKAEWGSMVLFFPQVVALYGLLMYVPKVPWMIVIPLLTIIFGYAFEGDDNGWNLPTLKTEFGVLSNVVAELPKMKALEECDNIVGLVVASASVALVAVLETLISAKIADFRSAGNQRGPFNEGREVSALSLAQVVCGVFGALPPTGVFVRTSVNQLNGATHLVAQLMNATLVLIVTASMMPIFAYLPLASVASVLVISAVRMVPVGYLKYLWKHAKSHFFLMLGVAAVCVIVDPVDGLIYGTLVAYLMGAMRSSNAGPAVLVTNEDKPFGLCRTITISGAITYANSDAIARRGASEDDGDSDSSMRFLVVPPSMALIDMSAVTEMDTDGVEALERMAVLLGRKIGKVRAEEPVAPSGFGTGTPAALGHGVEDKEKEDGITKIFMCSVSDDLLSVLESSPWFAKALESGRVLETREQCLQAHAKTLLRGTQEQPHMQPFFTSSYAHPIMYSQSRAPPQVQYASQNTAPGMVMYSSPPQLQFPVPVQFALPLSPSRSQAPQSRADAQ